MKKFISLFCAVIFFGGCSTKKIKEQDGITQNTLKLRANMSKAKLSYILQELERRGLVTRVRKGKTLEVHLKV